MRLLQVSGLIEFSIYSYELIRRSRTYTCSVITFDYVLSIIFKSLLKTCLSTVLLNLIGFSSSKFLLVIDHSDYISIAALLLHLSKRSLPNKLGRASLDIRAQERLEFLLLRGKVNLTAGSQEILLRCSSYVTVGCIVDKIAEVFSRLPGN